MILLQYYKSFHVPLQKVVQKYRRPYLQQLQSHKKQTKGLAYCLPVIAWLLFMIYKQTLCTRVKQGEFYMIGLYSENHQRELSKSLYHTGTSMAKTYGLPFISQIGSILACLYFVPPVFQPVCTLCRLYFVLSVFCPICILSCR